MPGAMDGIEKTNLYAVLGVNKAADEKEVRSERCMFGFIGFCYLSGHSAFMMKN
jgi:hypothetical protein